MAPEVAHPEVVRAVEHAAVGVAAAVDEVAVALGCRDEHDGPVEALGDERLGGLGAEVAEEHGEGVAAGLHGLVDGGEHVLLVLDRLGDLDHVEAPLVAGRHDRGAAALGERDREAVAAHRDDAELDVGDVLGCEHVVSSLSKTWKRCL